MAIRTVERDGEDDQVIRVSVVEFYKVGDFDGERGTPSGPKVEQNSFSIELGQLCFLTKPELESYKNQPRGYEMKN